jgi:hypothetical protein
MHNRSQPSPLLAIRHKQEPVLQLAISYMVHTPPETSSEEMGIRGRELVTALCLSKISFAISYEGVGAVLWQQHRYSRKPNRSSPSGYGKVPQTLSPTP